MEEIDKNEETSEEVKNTDETDSGGLVNLDDVSGNSAALEESDIIDLDAESSEEKSDVIDLDAETSEEKSEEDHKSEEKDHQKGEKDGQNNPFEKMVVSKDLRTVFDGEKEHHRQLFVPFYFAIMMLYMEFVFHIYSFQRLDINTVTFVLFTTAFAGLAGFICSLFPPKVNYAITIVFTAINSIYFCVQIVYKGVFQNYLSLSAMMDVAGQAMDYQDTIMKNVAENIIALILLLLPIVFILTPLRKYIDFYRKKIIKEGIFAVASIVIYIAGVLYLKITDVSMYSAYDVYKEYTSIDMAIEKLGVTQATVLDLGALFGIQYGNDNFEFSDAFAEITVDPVINSNVNSTSDNKDVNDSQTIEGESIEQEDKTPKKATNVLNIDFDQLIANSDDAGFISLNEYFKECIPTKTNEYTGMFEGYNVIFVTAEGFSGYALTEENFPTLYNMANTGFVFENYYTPLWYGSTVGGEYANLTGLMPANGQYLSLKETGKRKNSMRFTLATQLSNLGYASIGYHNNTYTYYGRDMSHPNMGYTWVGVGNGWEPQVTSSGNAIWPQSDDYMVETTFYDYCDTEPFHVYYLSVSGHVQYNFTGNAMAIKNKEIFEDREYSETTKAYLSCQYELEKAMTRLVSYLEDEGIADHTLIVLAPDHVPYDNKEVCDELAGHVLEDNFEWFENSLIIWSASMEEPVPITKVCSSLDILPTVSNLLGLDFDSRLMVGRDILSDGEGLVMFNNRSWITDQCMYNATNGEITNLTDSEVSEEYIKAVKSTVQTRFKVAEKILEYNYYSYIDDLYDDYEVIVPVKVADKMARAGFHTDGTPMTEEEKAEWNATHEQTVNEEQNNMDMDPDANTPVTVVSQEQVDATE